MSYALQVPKEYGYVLTVAASSLFINTYHFYLSANARKASGITYPTPYATTEQADKDPKAFAFNCAQRAHANFVENVAVWLAALCISGLRFPVAGAALGATWVVGRVLYAAGYTARGPKGRTFGFIVSSLSDLVLKGLAVYSAYLMI